MKLKAPIGIDDFKELIDSGYLYVDKTLMIEEVLETSAKVQLITRPRRFGKTINMSMLRYFFDNHVEDSAGLFEELAIKQRPCFRLQGRFPVIELTFKDLKADDFDNVLELLGEMLSELFSAHDALLEGLNASEQKRFGNIIDMEASPAKLKTSLAFLMKLLERHYNQKVILLIDEYDSPIHEGYARGYYEEVVGFMRPFLGKALKGNTSLHKAVITGILRIAKESIFSDLNNLDTFSMLDTPFADKFGFTEVEVAELLDRAGLSGEKEAVERWYNGYMVGETVIYNPWSILKYLDRPQQGFMAHWVNTSANLLVRDQVMKASPEVHHQLRLLIQGETLETPIQQHSVFRDLTADARTLWSFLLFGGYLKVAGRAWRNDQFHYRLAIPNTEVRLLFEEIITGWLRRNYGESSLQRMLNSLLEGRFQDFESFLGELVASVLSYYDTERRYAERVYHAFVLGLVVHLNNRYEIRSEREAGFGRYDLLMRPRNPGDRGIIMEFKAAETPEAMEAALDAAESQMHERSYGSDLVQAGVTLRSEIAIAFCGKKVILRGREITT